jgi:Flp pilus assembly protein TadG
MRGRFSATRVTTRAAGASRRRAGRRDGGAAAVEFALVAPLLFVVLFGIIDYGIYFADSIALRQGVREAARAGVVARFDASCTTPTVASNSAEIRQLACQTERGIPNIAGDLYVNIRVMNANGTATTDQWAYGNTLRVCVLQRHDSLLPLVPLPDGGIIRSRVDMAIENAADPPVTRQSGAEALPAGPGLNWTWC